MNVKHDLSTVSHVELMELAKERHVNKRCIPSPTLTMIQSVFSLLILIFKSSNDYNKAKTTRIFMKILLLFGFSDCSDDC